jgi:hypothetical protein
VVNGSRRGGGSMGHLCLEVWRCPFLVVDGIQSADEVG